MRVLFSCTGGDGHFLPTVPLATAAGEQGHTVVYATAPDLADRVRRAGFHLLPAGIGIAELGRRFAARRAEIQASGVDPVELRVRSFTSRFAETDAPAKVDALHSAAAAWEPDVIVYESADLAAPVVAAALGLPSVNHSFGRTVPAPALRSAAAAAAPLWRARGLEPDPLAGAYRGTYVDICPPSLQDEQPPPEVHVQRIRPADAGPRDRTGRPLVYATLGTAFNRPDRFRAIIDAAAPLDCDVTLTVGTNVDPALLEPVPGNVSVIHYLPQAEILPRASAVVTHGGSGSTWGALAHGCPLVLLPEGADQFENALACEAAGAGIALMPPEHTADALRAALARVLGEPSFARNAERIATEIASLPSPSEAASALFGG